MDEKEKIFQNKESAIKFPCHFPIKIMGKAHEDLKEAVIAILNQHAPEFSSDDLKIKPSNAGNYHSITATIHAKSREQLDAIYQALTEHELILMAL